MHCRSSSWAIGLAILCLLVTGLLGKIPGRRGMAGIDFTPETEAVSPVVGSSDIEGNSTLPVASEMKENSTVAVKIDSTSSSSQHTPVEETSRDPGRVPATARKKQVRRSQALSAGEQQYVVEREKTVLEALSNLGIACTPESVPRVALLGSAGGERAAASLIGSLSQMRADGLLDTLLYLGSESGSSWSMVSLYSDPMWSTRNISSTASSLWDPPGGVEEAMSWLAKRAKEEDFSLTDLWAVMTSVGISKKMDVRCLSKEAERPAVNPYPVYSAIEKTCNNYGPLKGRWFEFTPHESGFTDLGLFIDTSHLGSRLHHEHPEMDMVRLQGIVGSALADEQSFISNMPDELKKAVGWTLTDDDNFMDLVLLWVDAPHQVDTVWGATNTYMRLQHTLAKLSLMMREKNVDDPTVQSTLDGMEEAFKEHMNLNPVMFGKRSRQQRKELFDSWSAAIIKPIEDWSQGLEKGPFKDFVNWSVQKLFPVVGRWEWGTTENFLYRYPDFAVPSCLWANKHIQLMDAWSMLRMPYPPFLGDKRHVDLIIAMDYCSGEAFGSLTEARDYAAKVKKPFPEIDDRILEEKHWPNDCYVFRGERDQPTIIHMTLFNRKNCKDAEQVKQRMEEYSTVHLPYTREQVEFLMETAATNMENSKHTILTELRRTQQQKRYKWR